MQMMVVCERDVSLWDNIIHILFVHHRDSFLGIILCSAIIYNGRSTFVFAERTFSNVMYVEYSNYSTVNPETGRRHPTV